jgi:hypothetical protein
MDTQPHIENFTSVGVAREGSQLAGAGGKPFSPQTRHRSTKSETENGGILRVTADGPYVALPVDFTALRKLNVG